MTHVFSNSGLWSLSYTEQPITRYTIGYT